MVATCSPRPVPEEEPAHLAHETVDVLIEVPAGVGRHEAQRIEIHVSFGFLDTLAEAITKRLGANLPGAPRVAPSNTEDTARHGFNFPEGLSRGSLNVDCGHPSVRPRPL